MARIGNPTPLGLIAFALTTFVLSLYNGAMTDTFGTPSNVVIGLAMFYGGTMQAIAGIIEFFIGNTFGGTAFCSYGGFWLGFAAINIPWFGISDAFQNMSEEAVNHALGTFLLPWAILTFFLFIGSLRKSVGLAIVLGLLTITFILLTAGHWNANKNVNKAGGYFGLFTALAAWYTGLSALYADQPSIFQLPNPSLAPKEKQYDVEAQ
ncbi:hypothetical protein EV182_004380 [Spiromyces aspiralis]|uniref:Uncharacterized protein n=1 Tax=Spiromyces aspiralis TaxID=68401 RepID=A0ACC1HFK4_9FUNG|nr:hypothetical protein EV182_004380 [Spiromyces aspiralis]